MCSGLNRLCSLPPAAQRRPPGAATCRSEGGGGAGSNSFQSHHRSTRFGRCHGKLHQLSKPDLSGRHSQRDRHAKMESRVDQFGFDGGWGSTSDRSPTRERGADCVEFRGAGRDCWGCRGGYRSGTMLLSMLPVSMLSERPSPRFPLCPRVSSVCCWASLCTLFLRTHKTSRLPRHDFPHCLHPVLLCGGSCPHPSR